MTKILKSVTICDIKDGRNTNTDGWNTDFSSFPCSAGTFFVRGGYYGDNTSNTGNFAFSYSGGKANDANGFRSVLIAL